jgi:hypothetical protein
MSSAPLYVLDANAFIEPAKGFYAFDLVPKYWDNLASLGAAGRLCTIDRVAAEVLAPADVHTWINGTFSGCIQRSDEPLTLTQYAALMAWAQTQNFTLPAKVEFARVPDAFLVAYAAAVGGVVVTFETFDANCRRKVKIPNACHALGVLTVNPFQMLRALGVNLSR